jgi:hypothetical protein
MKDRNIRETAYRRREKRLARKFTKEEQRRKRWIGSRKSNRRFTSSYVIVPGPGIPCPRCGRPTQIREHRTITERHRRQPYYFTRWFRCMHRACHTTLIMCNEYKVWPGQPTHQRGSLRRPPVAQGFRAIRARKAEGGEGWRGHE